MRGSVIVMGDFDGIHRGHRVLISEAISYAQKEKLTSILLTYEPSPKKIMRKLTLDSRLTTHEEKKMILANTGLDMVIFYPVSKDTLRISARNFLRNFLLERLSMRHLVMGNDHHFGYNRRGNATYLKAAQARYGFTLSIVEEQLTHGKRTSSSRIREALAQGDTPEAADIIGRPYSVTGIVIRGEMRGRTIGFPTANLKLDPEKLLPAIGVYKGITVLENGERITSVANLGKKPTAGNFPVGVEIHLLNFTQDLYGKHLTFEFGKRLRAEKKFANFEELRAQIATDISQARL
ncbi:MAG: Riboflavin biosynthesis protein RibF [Turneriella sp.]|nr:Riboflavin biosynthesis protein RibF [Turneriella sp.]